ncbi:ATP-binding protein [Kitasatospora sp. NPDC008050]|uniref:ATP-binding protein n=1 Tax=Kitasatospora sp. NPDC008050 TaxID=3364021 RepID=UPI0036E80247
MVVHSSAFLVLRDPASVPRARSQVRTQVAGWGVRLDDEAQFALDTVTSELVTNAVRHTAEAMLTIGVHADPDLRRVLIEVYDGSTDLPRPRSAGPDDATGRGVFLVERLSLSHGAERTERGKRVWAELALPEQPLTRHQLFAQPRRAARSVARRLGVTRKPPIHPPTLVSARAH